MLLEGLLKGSWGFVSPLTGNYYENLGSLTIISIDHENGRMLGQLNTAQTGKVNIYGCLSEGGGIITFGRSSIPCLSADKTSSEDIKPQTGGAMKNTKPKAEAFNIMKNLDSKTGINTNFVGNNNDYLFKGFVFYRSCTGMDATFFGGQLTFNLPCKPDIAGYVHSSSGDNNGWRAFR